MSDSAAQSVEFQMISASWDSGPFSTYSKSRATKQETDRGSAWEYGSHTVLIPSEVWERYEKARSEFDAAEDAVAAEVERALERMGHGR